MKKIKIQQEFEYPLETLLRAREERYKRLDKFPELKNVHTVEERREGNILKQKREISLAESMPAVLTTLLPPGADKLVETSEFNTDEHIHTFHVIPGGNNENIFKIEGVSRYYEIDAKNSGRNYELEIISKALFVSGLVENAIADIYNKNLEKDRRSILHFIQILAEEEGAQAVGGAAEQQGGASGSWAEDDSGTANDSSDQPQSGGASGSWGSANQSNDQPQGGGSQS